MERNIIETKDGSHTISIPELAVTYHSHHGAIQESLHVFIAAGLRYLVNRDKLSRLRILEMGFGTGLNALLTFIETKSINVAVHYTSLELYPVSPEQASLLNYCEQLGRPELLPVWQQLHACAWDADITLSDRFVLNKLQRSLLAYNATAPVDLIYFDAFAPLAQPELWTEVVFTSLYNMLAPGGILVTYCSKGEVRRAMQAAGFSIEKIPGPPGKREMVRAAKNAL